MGTDDLKSMFKAAKAQRGSGGSLSKEQLKQLRAQKAANAQQTARAEAGRAKAAAAVAAAASAAAQSRPKGAAGMPPPAPRAPSGTAPAVTSSKAAVISSSGRPQAAVIRPKPTQAGQRSVNGAVQAPPRPSDDDDQQTAVSSDSQQAQWRQGNPEKQSTASTTDVSSHRQGDPAAARSTPDAASALLAADYGSDGEEASIQGSAATAAEARDRSQSANGLPQGFFEAAGSTAGEAYQEDGSTRAERAMSMESAASASLPTTAIPQGALCSHQSATICVCRLHVPQGFGCIWTIWWRTVPVVHKQSYTTMLMACGQIWAGFVAAEVYLRGEGLCKAQTCRALV
ncbi:TPA: hypothetical protein ACH3X1_016345 [Trebouxia sp. C0004]